MSELGNELKKAREANGLSLDDLQQLTKIQKRYLVGIENGDYGMMPGKFYVRAFIKQYAEAVGLNPEELFEQYSNEVPSVREEAVPEQLSRVQSKKTMSAPQSKVLEVLPKVLLVVFILGIAVFAWVFFTKIYSPNEELNSDKGGTEIKIEENATSTKEDEPNDKVSDGEKEDSNNQTDDEKSTDKLNSKQEIVVIESSGKNSTLELKNAEAFELKLVSTGEPWIEVKDENGIVLFSGVLNADQSQEFDLTDKGSVDLNIGRTTETLIYINDELIEYPVSTTESVSQRINIVFTKVEETE